MFVFLAILVVLGYTSALMVSDTYRKTTGIEGDITLNLTSLTKIRCGGR